VFGQTGRYEFINVDDDRCVYNNPQVTSGLTVSGIIWALTHQSPGISGWAPLTLLSHSAVWQCFGSNAGAHHLVNVLLHATSAVLLFLVLRSMTGRLWPSALVAALFAIHPLRAESVAWVTERKDVLSGVFFMLTVGAYVNYVRHPFSFARYAAVIVFFALALMSKSTVVTLPAALLLLDHWPLGRLPIGGRHPLFRDPSEVFLRWIPAAAKRGQSPSVAPTLPNEKWIPSRSRLISLVLEKIPLLGLVVVFSLQSIVYETETQPVLPEYHVSLAWRMGNALVSYATYLGQTVCPVPPTPFYLHPGVNLPVWKIIGAGALLLGISFGVLAFWRRCPYLLVGWLWYLGMLLPASGVVEFGSGFQGRGDRFTYLPHIGLSLAFVWAVADVCRCWPWRRWLLGGTSALALTILMGGAWRQTSFSRDTETVCNHILECSPRHELAHQYLGLLLTAQGRLPEAIQHFQKALEIKPESSMAVSSLGTALIMQGRLNEAVACYRRGLTAQPNSAVVHCALATALAMQGRLDEALAEYRISLRLQPDDASANLGIGGVLMARGQLDEAMAHCQRALELRPDLARVQIGMANILACRGRFDEALAHYQRALQIQPNLAEAHTSAGDVFAAQGRLHEALWHYQEALKIRPRDPRAQRSLAWLRATCADASLQNGAEAIELAQQANQLTGGKQPEVLDTLAAAYAAAGWFPEALATARKALELARQRNNHALVDALQDRITRYEAGKPYRETPMAPTGQ
jgi:tetratricopeptide (TPR) repeat protein